MKDCSADKTPGLGLCDERRSVVPHISVVRNGGNRRSHRPRRPAAEVQVVVVSSTASEQSGLHANECSRNEDSGCRTLEGHNGQLITEWQNRAYHEKWICPPI